MQNLKALDITGSLKDIAASKLGIRGWTEDLDLWLDNLKVVVNTFKPTARGDRKEYKVLEESGLEEAVRFIAGRDLQGTPKQLAAIRYILAASDELYGPEESWRLLERYIRYLHDSNDWEVRYNHVPKEIVGKYCGKDCYYTFLLEDRYRPELVSQNLVDPARFYNQQMQFGIEAELVGFAWDDDYAADLETAYKKEALEALRGFLLAPPISQALGLQNPVSVVEIKSSTSVEDLKKYFNPNNNQAENTLKLGQLLLQPKVRLALALGEVSSKLQNGMEHYVRREYPLFCKFLARYRDYEDRGEAREFLPHLNQALKAGQDNGLLTRDEQELMRRYAHYTLPNAAAETIESLALICSRFLGVDLEDPETWTGEYQAIFYYKLFKKVDKVISAFINGKNGRQMVQVVERVDGKPFLPRVADYRPLSELDLNLDYIRQFLATQDAEVVNSAHA